MIESDFDDDRDVIPRWRSVRRTVAAGEFQRLQTPRELTEAHFDELARFEARWRSKPDVVSASEFASAAEVAGESERAVDAVDHVRNTALGRRMLRGPDHFAVDGRPEIPDRESLRIRVRTAKQQLSRDPRNAIAWADLARHFAALGQPEKAERSLRVARALAPSSRYLLRSMTKLLVHLDRADEAYQMLSASDRTRRDPWLMSALLATGSAAGRPVRDIKQARRVSEDGNFRPIERAELETELATFELRSGSDKKALAGFRRSLASPTDNSLAQAQWASTRMPKLELTASSFDIPFAAEAKALEAAEAGRWHDALAQAAWWLEDQPFDSDAATLGSYAAAVGLGEWDQAIRFAELGLRASPRDLTLLNNLAYARIESGDLDGAHAVLRTIPESDATDDVAISATRGLLGFRGGDVAVGRGHYARAIELSNGPTMRRVNSMARAMLIREELRSGTAIDLESLAAAASRLARSEPDPGVQSVLGRVFEILTPRS